MGKRNDLDLLHFANLNDQEMALLKDIEDKIKRSGNDIYLMALKGEQKESK